MLVLAGMVVIAVLAGGLFCWTLAVFKLASGLPLIEWSERRPVPWALIDLVAIGALFIVVNVAASMVLHQLGLLPDTVKFDELELAERMTLTLANALVSLAILAIGLPLVAQRTGARLADFGWSAAGLLADLKLGVIAFVMIAPPVYAIQGILTQIWPSKHPLMEMFRETPDASFFAVLAFAAVVVAPLSEELLFRVLLQGFLERLFRFRDSLIVLIFGGKVPEPVDRAPGDDEVILAELAPAPLDPANPYAPSRVGSAVSVALPIADPSSGPPRGVAAWGPIAISSAIFALLHLPHGPDWVALLPLAAAMGYLYQRTHRLVPSLVVHALLNGLSMWGLWMQVYEMPQP
jgi:membrane protease YdiL (CAAX protease family)